MKCMGIHEWGVAMVMLATGAALAGEAHHGFNHQVPVTVTQGLSSPWVSAAFPVEPGGCYRVELETKAEAGALVASRYTDAGGTAIVSDNFNRVRPSGDWASTSWCFQVPPNAVSGEIAVASGGGKEFHIRLIRVEQAEATVMQAWQAAGLAALPPIDFVPPPDRWQALPQTHARLKSGEKLRIVMLGDSIINDTYGGGIELMLKHQWPVADVLVIPSVRGGTGVGYYQQEGRVREYVLDHKPDLVIIGGVSHGYDLGAMRSVISQIRTASDAEILILTGAMVPEDKFRMDLVNKRGMTGLDAAAQVREFNRGLPLLAHAMGAGFFDFRRVWDAYLYESGMPSACFRRDEIHGDITGKLLLAAMLSRYLGP